MSTTLLELLYAESTRPEQDIERGLRSTEALTELALVPGVAGDVALAVAAFLRIPVGNMAFAAYRKHRLVEKARATTRADSSWEVVRLGEHELEVKRRISVEGEVSGVRHALLELDLVATIKVETLTVTVVNGEITDAHSGRAEASVALKAGKAVVAQHDFKPVDLGSLVFGEKAQGPTATMSPAIRAS